MERLFFGCFFSETVRNALVLYLTPVRKQHNQWSWVAPAHYHLTIHFLGNQPEEKVYRAWDSIARACKSIQPFTVSLGAPEPFPSRRRFTPLQPDASRFQTPLETRFQTRQAGEARPLRPHSPRWHSGRERGEREDRVSIAHKRPLSFRGQIVTGFTCLALLPAASPPLHALYHLTGEILDRNGIARLEREKSFQPHCTVAKPSRSNQQLPEDPRLPPFGSLTLQSLSLVRSATEVGGTRYDERRRITFTNA